MKKFLPLFFVILFSPNVTINAQTCQDMAVELTATPQTGPPSITLNWVANANTSQYDVYRKSPTATSWGIAIATLTGTATQYIDNTVSVGTSYEYRVLRVGSGFNGFGYVNAGINVPAIEYRGKVILLVDSTFTSALSAELQRLRDDLEGDGWDVIRHDVLRAGTVTHVRSLVMADYALDPVNTKAIFIVGHVPVPYSGNINPDGHPDHLGAWPTDTYYADVNGGWTDATVTTTNVVPARTQNVPGDGKFDQSVIPTDLELQAGRADFSNLPSFSSSEQVLLKNYLDKDHNYRKKVISTVRRGVIDDNFGYFSGEAFAASGFMNMGPLVDPSTVAQADYFTNMSAGNYLWSYGCGGGSYTSSSGIGTTSNFASSSLDGIFTMLFGSYFGDWDSQDNFLRAPLAQGNILTSVWSGRPYYHFHHMGMGQNIGYSVMLTQNNIGSLYFSPATGITGRWVHNALMGDPTLRNDVVAPVSNVVATKAGTNCQITWSASTETAVIGYNIYMKNDTNTAYVKINPAPVTGTSYTDLCLQYKGIYKYMVRTLILQTNPSGTYYNMSEGIADTAMNTNGMKVYASFTPAVSGNTVSFSSSTTNATTYSWNFGDAGTSTSANPTHVYAGGTYTVMLIASNSCASDTVYYSPLTISTVGVAELSANAKAIQVYPNPCSGKLFVNADKSGGAIEARVYNSEGRQIYYSENMTDTGEIDLIDCRQGLYLLQLTDKNKTSSITKFVVE